jgi:Uma2 family endonuclease
MFARFEVPEYWIVDPAYATLEVLQFVNGSYREVQNADGDDIVRSPLLAPFTFSVADAFRLP